jgi:two-component system phosphate regulon sensor histidine kinase PhoR
MELLTRSVTELEQEISELRSQLEEANDTIEAIRTGQVDALIVKDKKGHQLYTLKSADQTYRVFIEKMKEGAVTLNNKGIILYSNSRFASMVGMPLAKVIGLHFETLVPGEFRETFDKLIEEGWQSESKGEIYLINHGNELTPFLISLTTLELDEGTALSIILTDLTIPKETEKELKLKNDQLQQAHLHTAKLNNELEDKVKERTNELLLSREHFKFLADNIPVIVWTATPDGYFDYYNKRWYEYTGKTLEESKGSGWQTVVHPDDLPQSLIAWNHSIRTGEPFKVEDRKLGKDGNYRWHLGHALPFKNNNKEIIAWFGICTNIEDQKKAMEKKDEFISVASHELKTPVTSLKGFTQILQMAFEKEGNVMANNLLPKMDQQINKLTNLINDLLDVTKVNSGQLRLDEEKFEFNELVKETVEEMQRTTTTHKIETNFTDTVYTFADKNRIGQVLINLLSNAIKYSPNADKVIVTCCCEDGKLKLCVQDFGIGIPEAQQPKLFTRFFRVSDDKTNTYPGLGLGLYITNEIIKRHNGTIDFKSEEGKGSIFCFSLPISNEKASA